MTVWNRSNLSVLFCLTAFVCFGHSQTVVVERDSFLVGTQTVKVPPPTGFVNAYKKVDSLTKFFDSSADPEARLLGVLVQTDIAVKLKNNQRIGTLDFYIEFFVPKMMLNTEVTPRAFAEFVTKTEKDLDILINKNHPENEAAKNRVLDSLQELNGRPANIEIKPPKNLGTIDKQADVFSTMVLTDLVTSEGTSHMLGVRSYVLINKRMLYINTYKRITSEKDIAPFRDFAKIWIAAIIAANK